MKGAVVLFVAVVCLLATYVHCTCLNEGDVCDENENNQNCCNNLDCEKPPKTCGGVCNTLSCSPGSGTNRASGVPCQTKHDCESPLDCRHPNILTCGQICPECSVAK